MCLCIVAKRSNVLLLFLSILSIHSENFHCSEVWPEIPICKRRTYLLEFFLTSKQRTFFRLFLNSRFCPNFPYFQRNIPDFKGSPLGGLLISFYQANIGFYVPIIHLNISNAFVYRLSFTDMYTDQMKELYTSSLNITNTSKISMCGSQHRHANIFMLLRNK